jgi:hypothetical protein
MNDTLHIAKTSDDDAAVLWVEISPAPEVRPFLRRPINLREFVNVGESAESIHQRIDAQCAVWFDRHNQLLFYCELAKQWLGETAKGTQIQLVTISAKGATWEYMWADQPQRRSFYFTEDEMCIDWVSKDGLTQRAKDFIISAVALDVEEHEAHVHPDRLKKEALIQEFLKTVVPRQHDC